MAELICDQVTSLDEQVEDRNIGIVVRSGRAEVARGRIPGKVPDDEYWEQGTKPRRTEDVGKASSAGVAIDEKAAKNPDEQEVVELMCDQVTRLDEQVEVPEIGMVVRSSRAEFAVGRIPVEAPDDGYWEHGTKLRCIEVARNDRPTQAPDDVC